MINKSKLVLSCTATMFCLVIAACSSDIKKADIPNTANPQEEIAKLNTDLNFAVTKNVDVLAPDEFKNGVKWYDEAKADLGSGEKQEEILNDVRKGRGYLQKGFAMTENRQAKAAGLFEARQAALTAGANRHPELKNDLKDLDSDVSSKADKLSDVSTEKLAKLQNQYIDLERRSVILNQLGTAQAMVNGAKKDGATKKAPTAFKRSELSLKTAESVISTNVRNPEGFEKAVTVANTDASFLNDVMATIKENGKTLSESAATKMVMQNKQIKNLKTDLSTTTAQGVATEAAMQNQNDKLSAANENQKQDLANQKQDLNTANAQVEVQRALEDARKQFSNEEAEAYQQGDTLLIRLKQVNFASGRADLPESSMSVLAKVSNVAKSLHASEIKVEGHTDSTGTPTQNQAISEKRASAVASYFRSNGFKNIEVQSEGYGFAKPIATNKSKEGRAQNRRVDIIITPSTETSIK